MKEELRMLRESLLGSVEYELKILSFLKNKGKTREHSEMDYSAQLYPKSEK